MSLYQGQNLHDHLSASFDMTEWGKVFFIGSEDANTVFASSEPKKKLSPTESCRTMRLRVKNPGEMFRRFHF